MCDNKFKITLLSRDGAESEMFVACKWEVCPGCEGSGTELYGSLKGYAFSAEEWNNEDPDFREDYMSGNYDVPCSECRGRTTVKRPNVTGLPLSTLKDYLRHCHEEREFQNELAYERSMRERGIEF